MKNSISTREKSEENRIVPQFPWRLFQLVFSRNIHGSCAFNTGIDGIWFVQINLMKQMEI